MAKTPETELQKARNTMYQSGALAIGFALAATAELAASALEIPIEAIPVIGELIIAANVAVDGALWVGAIVNGARFVMARNKVRRLSRQFPTPGR